MSNPPPKDSQFLDFERALRYHRAWNDEDREFVRVTIEEDLSPYVMNLRPIGPNLRWYVPPSGGYVGGYRVRNAMMKEHNLVVLHPLSISLRLHSRKTLSWWLPSADPDTPGSSDRSRSGRIIDSPVCERCFLAHAGECM